MEKFNLNPTKAKSNVISDWMKEIKLLELEFFTMIVRGTTFSELIDFLNTERAQHFTDSLEALSGHLWKTLDMEVGIRRRNDDNLTVYIMVIEGSEMYRIEDEEKAKYIVK